MTTRRTLTSAARAECSAYAGLAMAGLVGTQLALLAMLRDADGGAGAVRRDLTLSPVAVFTSVDLVVVFLAATVFMVVEGRRLRLRWWALYPVLGCAVAISVGLPLFLLARRLHVAARQ